LQEIAAQVAIVLSDDGRLWIPELGLNTLGEMQPGEGYYIFVNENVTFTFVEAPGMFEAVLGSDQTSAANRKEILLK